MRRQYDDAQGACLAVLNTDPENVDAHILMGDISADRGDLEAAERWYELAVEHDSESGAAADRLRHVHTANLSAARVRKATGWNPVLLGSAVLALIGICAFVAFLLGQNSSGAADRQVIRDTISATDAVEPPEKQEPLNEAIPSPPVQPPVREVPESELALLRELEKSNLGGRMIAVSIDPRTRMLTVTFRLNADDVPRKVAAEMARDALAIAKDSTAVTLRGVTAGEVTYVADVQRIKLDEISSPEWQQANPGEEAWVEHILSNEWPIVPKPAPENHSP